MITNVSGDISAIRTQHLEGGGDPYWLLCLSTVIPLHIQLHRSLGVSVHVTLMMKYR